MSSSLKKKYQNAFDDNNWAEAEKLIRLMVQERPHHVWTLGQLSLVLYEQNKYEEAFEFSSKALALDHKEPLTLWIHAGNLEMLGFTNQAFNIWDYLVHRSSQKIGLEDCTEGIDWARSLQVDCLYRMAQLSYKDGTYDDAMIYINRVKSRMRRKIVGIYDKDLIFLLDGAIKAKIEMNSQTS